MEKSKNDIDYLEEVAGLIDDTTMSRLDFDEIKARLLSLRDGLAAQAELAGEHALLREEYEQRIAGMAKAIAAVDRKRNRMEEALALVEGLPVLTSAKLLETYRRVAARFRDCFPGSFGIQNIRDSGTRQATAAGTGR